jgi:hypothetical protein
MLAAETEVALRTYVPVPGFARCFELLERRHSCVIVGAPGVGKTTLAQAVAAAHVANGFDLVEITEDVDEAFSVWNNDSYQVFYYDDFLGQTALEDKLRKNEDSRLLRLLDQVAKNPRKRLILTTREYILAQARQRYERLGRTDFNPLTNVVDITAYQLDTRAQILYNHVFFAELTDAQKASFSQPDAYLPIVEHQNFNPRLVALSLNLAGPGDATAGGMADVVRRSLDDPSHLWEHLVENQLTATQVALLEVAYSFGAVNIGPLQQAWRLLLQTRRISAADDDFRKGLQVLEGTLLTLLDIEETVRVALGNPSVSDFMSTYYQRRPDALFSLLKAVGHFEQISRLSPRLRADDPSAQRHVVKELISEHLYVAPLSGSLENAMPRRLLTAILVARTYDDEQLRTEFIETIEESAAELVHDCTDLYQIAELVQYLRELAAEGVDVGSVLEAVDDHACQRISDSLCDWDSAREAITVAEELGLDLGYRLEQQIEATRAAGAFDLVRRWRDGDTSVAQREDLEEILAVVDTDDLDLGELASEEEQYGNPVRELHNLLSLAEVHPYMVSSNQSTNSTASMKDDIARLFARLSHASA